MTSKFEQLIEFVINDEEDKAKELFHDIVVEKSREIYENLMNEEEDDEEEDSEEEEDLEEGQDCIGGDASDDLMQDVESDEAGIQEEESDAEFDDEAEEDGEDLTHDIEGDHDEGDIEGRVIDLEDKLDELMAEFESMMGGDEHGDSVSDIDGGDALAQDDTDTAEFDDESMMENINLAAAPKPVTSEPAGTNTKSTVAFNSGAKGMEGSPVKATGDIAKGRPAPSTQAVSSDKFQNEPATGSKKLSPAPKPTTAQAAGVNTRTPFPKG